MKKIILALVFLLGGCSPAPDFTNPAGNEVITKKKYSAGCCKFFFKSDNVKTFYFFAPCELADVGDVIAFNDGAIKNIGNKEMK
jgi:hypothetical protein